MEPYSRSLLAVDCASQSSSQQRGHQLHDRRFPSRVRHDPANYPIRQHDRTIDVLHKILARGESSFEIC